ncbi:MAG: hypothetical protein ABSF55_02215 [Candidatus Staskawiczbacteria bacterium]
MSENNFVKTKKIKKFLIIGFFLVFLFFYNIIFTQLIHDVGAKLPWAGWIGISDRSIYAVGDAGSCDITNPARNDECDENNICDGPVNPKQFQCNKTNIEQLYKAGNCDLKTCKCQRQWTIINSCTGNPQPVAGTAKCTDQGVRQQFAYSVCTSSTVNNCRSENPDQTGYCGTCASIKQWKTILPCTNGCVFAIDQPSTRCGASPVPGDSGIEQKFNCTQCVINAQGGSCPPTVEWRPTIDCGSPQNVVKQFCSNGVQCTMTVNYPGQCFYMDAQPTPCGCIDSTAKCDLYGNCTCVPPAVNGNTFTTCTTGSWVGGCKAPTVSMVCNGPCGVNGNNGNSGPCSPDGSTNTCADGTTQTCSSGTWGACNNGCASGTTDPHSVCNSDGTCTSASGCAASVDCTKCCPTGQNNPHYECQSDASCAEVNTCGADECSPGNAGTKCGCNPNDPTKKNCPCGGQQTCQADGTWSPCPAKHTECVKGDTGNVCQCVDGSGDDQCKAVGAQCGCCTPGDVADCTCGGQKTCGPDGNWSICSEHADCQNGVCACDNTSSGDDSCQIGASCSCTNGTTQNCPCGGTQTCTNGVWSACPACSCPGQCANGQTLPCPCGGTQQCVNGVWSQCPDKHTDCLNDICQCVDGLGSNNCTVVGASCVCNNGDKLNCPCGGTQTCTNGVWSACPAKHTDCLNGTCQCVDGSGPINCTTVGGSCCTSGQTKPCGDCGTRTCNSSGAWDSNLQPQLRLEQLPRFLYVRPNQSLL